MTTHSECTHKHTHIQTHILSSYLAESPWRKDIVLIHASLPHTSITCPLFVFRCLRPTLFTQGWSAWDSVLVCVCVCVFVCVCVCVCVCVRGINISNGDIIYLPICFVEHFNTDSRRMGLKQGETVSSKSEKGRYGDVSTDHSSREKQRERREGWGY